MLQGHHVDLQPLDLDDLPALYEVAADKALWKHIPTDCSRPDRFMESYTKSIQDRDAGIQYPFLILGRDARQIIGSTRLFDLHPQDRKLEIGWTWIAQAYWGTDVNLECKSLLLTFCFETLGARRVQLKTDELNIRSRKAIEKIGARFEGILRKDRIKEDGLSRNAAYYSIIDEEWPAVKEALLQKLTHGQADL